jgi:hypothetical protein
VEVPADIFSTEGPVVYFPVRHHSPTAAVMARALIGELRPAAVLIEGPSDFNDRLGELGLPHELPIAIYSYVRLADDRRRGAYYPFCVYSPEWQAFCAARECGAVVRFIDLPYADVAAEDDRVNRYSDADFRRSRYVRELCRKLGVDTFDAVWDTFFELDRGMTPREYLERAHQFCGQLRLVEGQQSRQVDRRREAFMAADVRRAVGDAKGAVVVVTGGYHCLALHARLKGGGGEGDLCDPPEHAPSPIAEGEERGIAITPYSYERLDSLRGYEAGMPNPGYYDRLWQDRQAGRPIAHRRLLFDVARNLRDRRKQRVSSADLIAAEACAAGLARLRGHGEVWRTDLVDGLTGSLIKDELAAGGTHPLLDAIHEVLRGDARGRLAAGAALPPLVRDLQALLDGAGLTPQTQPRDVEFDLLVNGDRERSRLLHRLRILGIGGFSRTAGTDFASRGDLSRLWEQWRVQWSPEFDSSAIEAARYGPTVAEGAANRLAEQARGIQRSAERGALLLLDASLADLNALGASLHGQLAALVRQDGEFLSVTTALGHLLYLYRFDETMGTQGRGDVGLILSEAFARGLWLLEVLGQMIDPDGQTVRGVASLLDAFERCEQSLALDRADFTGVLSRVAGDRSQRPAIRGAAVGALWVLGRADAERVRGDLKLFADPDHLGDFLTGLFALARELVQRDRELILAIDAAITAFVDEQFLTALPSLRLAFTYFTPREKHHMAASLLEALGLSGKDSGAGAAPLAALEVRPEDAARALAFEGRLFAAMAAFGLRGANEEDEP